MARILITGSSDGLGVHAARRLIAQGHEVILHARNEKRADAARKACEGAKDCLVADLSSIAATKSLAQQANSKFGTFDAVIHNAGLGFREPSRNSTVDDLPAVFAVNSMAPYILTCLMKKPRRLVYMTSGLHSSGDPSLQDLAWKSRPWSGFNAYADTKFQDVLLSNAVSRHWPDVYSNAVSPGWVETKMGGKGAPEDLAKGSETQAWLAVSEEAEAKVSGKLLKHKAQDAAVTRPKKEAWDEEIQEKYLRECERISGIKVPWASNDGESRM